MDLELQKYDIVVIDSGNNLNVANGVSIIRNKNSLSVEFGCCDDLQHGTAINYILMKNYKNGRFFNIALKGEEDDLTIEHLTFALEYIRDHIFTKAILICLGVTKNSSSLTPLKDVISQLVKKDVLVVSAMDNAGYISYPAAFDNVMSIEEQPNISFSRKGYYAYLNSYTNIKMPQRYYPTLWENQKLLLHGNSFAAAYFISNFFNNNPLLVEGTVKELWLKIYSDSLQIIKINDSRQSGNLSIDGKAYVDKIKNAIIFPVNKETMFLETFSDFLTFRIINWYDIKYGGKCGKKVSSIIPESISDLIVRDIQDIDFEDPFDTIIIGHTNELEKITGTNYRDELIKLADKYNKKVYLFDSLCDFEKNHHCCFPYVSNKDVNYKMERHLNHIDTVVLGVFGTSSRQGKYTLQLKLKREFIKRQIKVCHLSTEPNGYLLGADFVYPMGYNSNINLSFYESVNCLNQALANMEIMFDPDIIIAGSQSGTIPYDICSLDNILPQQHIFFTGINPSCVILCVNVFDELEYIERTIQYIKSFNCVFLGVAFFPFVQRGSKGINNIKFMNSKEIDSFKHKILDVLHCKAFNISCENDISKICDNIISFYA